MDVSRIMTKGVITVGMDATLLEAKEIMENENIRHIPVVDEVSKELVGIVSDRDILANLSPRLGTTAERNEDRECLKKKIHRVMSRNPLTVKTDAEVKDVARILASKKVSCVPVVDEEGILRGIVTVIDILKYAAEGN